MFQPRKRLKTWATLYSALKSSTTLHGHPRAGGMSNEEAKIMRLRA